MRVCLIYDCLYPYTVGGGERWYRNLAERLVENGHEVTYLTLRQWEPSEPPAIPGVRVVAVGPRVDLYSRDGRRRIRPTLVFAAGVLAHLLRHGRSYDVVHTAGLQFTVLAASLARRLGRFRLVVDWFEVWTRDYWREYLGGIAGRIGWSIQGLSLRARQTAICFAELHAERLRALGFRGEVLLVRGLFEGVAEPGPPSREPVLVYAGRLIPEKRVQALVEAFVEARARIPELRCEIYGDGPERGRVLELIDRHGLGAAVEAPGFVERDRIEQALGRALCLVLPSRREGYGLVVVEAASKGTPSIVVSDPDNAAVELVEDGVNGVVAASAEPGDLAEAIVRVHEAGAELVASTVSWYARHAEELSVEGSLSTVLRAYSEL